MRLLSRLARVRAARAEVHLARAQVAVPTDALLARVQHYPLTSVSAAAGLGALMAQMDFHPLRIPGASGLLSSGVLELVSHGVRLFAETGWADPDPS